MPAACARGLSKAPQSAAANKALIRRRKSMEMGLIKKYLKSRTQGTKTRTSDVGTAVKNLLCETVSSHTYDSHQSGFPAGCAHKAGKESPFSAF
jgi:hypothetical protein